jgi:hypothetical protein
MEDLTSASHKLAEEIYKQAGAKQQQQGPSTSTKEEKAEEPGPQEDKKKEDIIDAEYKEEDEK